MDLLNLVSELSRIDAPSGFEDAVAERISDILRPCVDEVRRDVLGNVIAVKRCGKRNAMKILLDAHMDEVGFIVTGSEEGFLKFSLLGSIDPRNLPGCEITLLTKDPIYGVIACLPPHILSGEEREKAIAVKDLYIDVGLPDGQVPIGTVGVFKGSFKNLGQDCISGKALDNRLCLAIMLDTVTRLKDARLTMDLYVMASVQEELGTRGAGVGAFGILPDCCIAIDVTHARTPDAPKTGVYKAGEGPTIGLGPNMNRKFSQKLIETCQKSSIPYQIEVMAGSSGTNAWPIQISREGVATAVLSVPLKYMHSPVEVARLSDALYASDLLTQLLREWGNENA